MGATELQRAAKLLRGGQLFPATIREAQGLVISSGQRINDINVALYFAEKGDGRSAKMAANRAADAISRLL